MSHPKKIVLHCASEHPLHLDTLVEEFIRDGVVFIGVVGRDCSRIEDTVDELVVGDGRQDRYILTSSHPDESVQEAVLFAQSLTGEFAGAVHVLHA